MKPFRFFAYVLFAILVSASDTFGQNVGIGTTSPAELFTVADTTEPVLRLESTNGGLLDWEARVANGYLIFRGGADASGIGLTDYISFSSVGFVGIGELFPAAKLHIRDGAILSEGIFIGEYNGAWPTTGSGARLMWVPEKSAFRVGNAWADEWDIANVGDFSFVGGGENNKAFGVRSFVGGGGSNSALGDFSFVGGGEGNTAASYGETVFGLNSTLYVPNNPFAYDGMDRLFVIGNGIDTANRSNALTILKNGNVGIRTSTPTWNLDIVGVTPDNGSLIQLSNSDKSQFLRMFSGRLGDPKPFLQWKTGSPFLFQSSNNDQSQYAELMRISASGNLGIGTSAPVNKLDVEGGVAIGSTYSGTSSAPTNGAIIEGKVGIGTTTADAKLHIEDAAPGLMLKDNDNLSTAAGSSGIINAYGSDGVGGTSTGRLWYLGSNSFSTSDAIFGNQTPAGKLLFATNGAARMTIDAAGKVGIGILAPNNNLEVNDQSRFSVDVTNPDYVRFGNVDNSLDVTSLEGAGAVQVVLDANNNDADTKAFYIRKNTSDGPILMTVGESGNVGIGTTTLTNSDMASGYKLSVNGKIASTEVRVQPTADWPDYVFSPSYTLMPLEELEQSIAQMNHLPGIPSAQEVKKEGIMLGEMQTLSIEKIEELTLYLLQMNKEMKELKQQVYHLQKENAAQANEISKLNKD